MLKHALTLIASAVLLLAAGAVSAEDTARMAPDKLAHMVENDLRTEIKRREAEFRTNPSALYQFAGTKIEQHFDFPYIAQLVLGKNWRQATPAQRERFTLAFKNMLIRTYANAVLEHYNTPIEWEPMKLAAGATDVTINSKVIRKSGPPVPISYRVHQKGGDWRVYDVLVDAVSLVTNYRGTFSTEIKKNGLDALIAKLESKQAGS